MNFANHPLYRYTINEEHKENYLNNIIIAPTLNLVLRRSYKYPEVHCPNNMKDDAWDELRRAYRQINYLHENENVSVDKLFEGFEGYHRVNDNLFYRRVTYFEETPEKSRILRLMINKPTLRESVEYGFGRVFGDEDRYRLKQYIGGNIHIINEQSGGNDKPLSLHYTDGALLQLNGLLDKDGRL